MSHRYICVHGHFYQPPRENPWIEEVEREESAHPFHNWNERICHEAYAPNAYARILDEEGRIVRIVNNYARISFNFGATLLSWMARRAPDIYGAVIEADRSSRERFSGHGSAIAQGHGHVILPLANAADKRTQVVWGIRDFQYHFGRDPEGMWLPEAAVDLETLDILAEHGIRFTILAPRQARQVRKLGEGEWRDVGGERVDPSRAYRVSLPSGRDISVFFYDGILSRAVAFEQVLSDGGNLAARLMEAGGGWRQPGSLTHFATDGETFGHHHRHGDMALSYALHLLEGEPGIRLTNYGEYLARHPPVHEATIIENSSWSCAHGVERWRADCGCSTGGHTDWRQDWRAPLREALDWLRDELAPRYEKAAGMLLLDPWGARDHYIEVVLDRDPDTADAFLEREAGRPLERRERVRALQLLELQRHTMLMYTSCGWFFDDLARIETLQVLRYAARVVQLAENLFEASPRDDFLGRLALARSNVPALGTGRDLYADRIEPGRVGLSKVAAHHAVTHLFDGNGEPRHQVYCYRVTTEDHRVLRVGRSRFAMGRVEVTSRITHGTGNFSYAVLHMGDHRLIGGVRPFQGMECFGRLALELSEAFEANRTLDLIRTLDREFHASTYSLHSLFHDEQERIVGRILESSLEEAEAALGGLYESRMGLMRFLADLGMPQPPPFKAFGDFILNTRLERALRQPAADVDAAESLIREAEATGLKVEKETLRHAVAAAILGPLERLAESPYDRVRMGEVERLTAFARSLPFQAELWSAQNTFFRIMEEAGPERIERAGAGDPEAIQWLQSFRAIGLDLGVAVREP